MLKKIWPWTSRQFSINMNANARLEKNAGHVGIESPVDGKELFFLSYFWDNKTY